MSTSVLNTFARYKLLVKCYCIVRCFLGAAEKISDKNSTRLLTMKAQRKASKSRRGSYSLCFCCSVNGSFKQGLF